MQQKNLLLVCTVLLFIAASTAQALCVKRSGYLLPPFFVLFTVASGFCLILVAFAIFTHFISGGFVNSSWKLSKHCLFIGLLNGLNGLCVLFSNPFVAGSVQALFAQANVAFTMALSWCLLGERYVSLQWVGAVLIVLGILVEFVPNLASEASGFMFGWSLLFVTGQIPSAAQSVYQESVFRNAQVNVIYMLAWSSIGQAILLCSLLPMDILFSLVTSTHEPALVQSLMSGWNISLQNQTAALVIIFYMIGMLLTMTAQTILVKYSSASLQSLILTMVTPCSSLAFSIPLLCPPPYTEPLKVTTCFALLIVVTGVLLFRHGETSNQEDCADPELKPLIRQTSVGEKSARPSIMNSRMGAIASEWSAENREGSEIPIWLEYTTYSTSQAYDKVFDKGQ